MSKRHLFLNLFLNTLPRSQLPRKEEAETIVKIITRTIPLILLHPLASHRLVPTSLHVSPQDFLSAVVTTRSRKYSHDPPSASARPDADSRVCFYTHVHTHRRPPARVHTAGFAQAAVV